jgi:hypothetical protein
MHENKLKPSHGPAPSFEICPLLPIPSGRFPKFPAACLPREIRRGDFRTYPTNKM